MSAELDEELHVWQSFPLINLISVVSLVHSLHLPFCKILVSHARKQVIVHGIKIHGVEPLSEDRILLGVLNRKSLRQVESHLLPFFYFVFPYLKRIKQKCMTIKIVAIKFCYKYPLFLF